MQNYTRDCHRCNKSQQDTGIKQKGKADKILKNITKCILKDD